MCPATKHSSGQAQWLGCGREAFSCEKDILPISIVIFKPQKRKVGSEEVSKY